MLMTDARKLGDESCTTCTENGGIKKGLRYEVQGTVLTVDPPVLEVQMVKHLKEGEKGCAQMMEDAPPTTTTDKNMTSETDESPGASAGVVASAAFSAFAGLGLLAAVA